MGTDIPSTALSSRYILLLHPGPSFCKSSYSCNTLFSAGLSLLSCKFHEDSIALSLEREPVDSLQCRDSGNR